MTSYRSYLYIHDDDYCLTCLRKYIGDNSITNVSETAYTNATKILSLQVQGVSLTDKYNETIARQGRNSRINLRMPLTLFAPYTMTYDPDILQNKSNLIGWPIQDQVLQNKGYNTIHQGQNACIRFTQNGITRFSPYSSHCSAYVAYVAQQVFKVNINPQQIGNWCNAAAGQRELMQSMTHWWRKVDSITAQLSANEGKLVIATRVREDSDDYAHGGHIAIVLPLPLGLAQQMQKEDNYPKTPIITDENSYKQFIQIYGPEITQAGGLNFSHTITANGFPKRNKSASIDSEVEFYVYRL